MNTELPKEVPYGQRAKVGDAPKTDARLESPPLETNTKLLKDSICTLATNTGKEFTVGILHSFSDNGYFSPQKLVQSTYIFLKCSQNYFGKF